MIWRVGDWYYLTYDAFPPEGAEDIWTRNMLARSRDLVAWEKMGPQLCPTQAEHPDLNMEDYADSTCACSPWFYQADISGICFM